eukprot:jgi/Mesvir1/15306/Mv06513-RA.3
MICSQTSPCSGAHVVLEVIFGASAPQRRRHVTTLTEAWLPPARLLGARDNCTELRTSMMVQRSGHGARASSGDAQMNSIPATLATRRPENAVLPLERTASDNDGGVQQNLARPARRNILETPQQTRREPGRQVDGVQWEDQGELPSDTRRIISGHRTSLVGRARARASEFGALKAEELRSRLDAALRRDGDALDAVAVLFALIDSGKKPAASPASKLIALLCGQGFAVDAYDIYATCTRHGISLLPYAPERLTQALAKCGETRRALELHAAARNAGSPPNPAIYCSLISALGKEEGTAGPQQAMELWREALARGVVPDLPLWNSTLVAAVSLGPWDVVEGILEDMRAAGVPLGVRTFNILIKGYGIHGRAEDARTVLSRMRRCRVSPSSATYSSLVVAFVRLGLMPQAEGVLRQARVMGAPPDVKTYTALIKGYCDGDMLADATATLQKMREEGITPNEVSYTTVIDACTRSLNLSAAKKVLSQMVAAGVAPNAVTYNALLRGYSQCMQLRDVKELVAKMKERGVAPTPATYNTLIDACIRHQDSVGAMAAYEEMRREGIAPTAVTYTTLIKCYCLDRQPGAALRIFRAMEEDGRVRVDAAAYNALIHCFACAGMMADAAGVLSSMRRARVPPSRATYGALISGYGRTGEIDAAMALYEEMSGIGGQVAPDERVYDMLVDGCVRAERFCLAMALVERMQELGVSPDKFVQKYPKRSMFKASSPKSNVAFERFKFWLGLRNSYYDSDFDWRDCLES